MLKVNELSKNGVDGDEGSGEVDLRLGGGTLPDVKSQLLYIILLVEWRRGLQPQLRKCCPLTAAKKQKPKAGKPQTIPKREDKHNQSKLHAASEEAQQTTNSSHHHQ